MGIINCIGCKWCISECPVEAIYVASVNDYYKNIFIRDDECICCGACKNVCPTQDIYFGLPPECRGSGGGGSGGGSGGDSGGGCLLYTSPSPRDRSVSGMTSDAC